MNLIIEVFIVRLFNQILSINACQQKIFLINCKNQEVEKVNQSETEKIDLDELLKILKQICCVF